MTALDTYVRSYADTLRIARGYVLQAEMREDGAETALFVHARELRKQHGAETTREWIERAQAEATAPTVCEAPAPKPAPRARAARVKGETRAERSARNKAAWAAGNRGEAAK